MSLDAGRLDFDVGDCRDVDEEVTKVVALVREGHVNGNTVRSSRCGIE